ncbi:uncharacterized protein Z520_08728 [Fonsecaea multimorphosa CBS 102226]|uniref:Uncharacterized protein n=1 Tax=Fonsecaea multimorphosa CBS 102226 TaxID=1442371 RepID=A0A0D2KG09_9EURO|nr:uncharacterized protein Z520_08728 [Fonsecaea multimorphosa CBS 102226]KIX95608.1 hypothetical protein Z520_08728 [Fonsecaea multimorphosa CBS 102226]OAL21213.1 hypothetical protein AYO22_08176 [Fonsecaea multimorphosa]
MSSIHGRNGPVAHYCNIWALAMCLSSLLIQQTYSQQLVGCDVLDCDGGANNECTLGNTTSSFIGTASFNTSLSPNNAPLTWTVGASSSTSGDVTFTKRFYLGSPPSMNLANPTGFAGCALFFEGIARSLPLNGVTEYGPVTCGQTLQDACVNDLLSQAQKQVQTLGSTNNLDNSAVCTALQTTMEANPPQSCQTIATVTWGTIVPKEITGPQSPVDAPIAQTTCHPSSNVSSGTKYNIALIETQTVTSEDVSSDLAPFFYSITPVLTVFYSPAAASSNAQDKTLPEAHLTCVKVVQDSNLTQQVGTNGAGMVGLPRSMMALALALSILALV